MNSTHKDNQKGFTIIEVVLVLAIAGLIFLMVFIALPALQRSQRDTQRRDDVSRFISQLSSYATNNRGAIPAATATAIASGSNSFAEQYLKRSDGEFQDPQSGENYTFSYGASGTATTSQMVYGGPNTECNGENVVTGGGQRSTAVKVQLEGSGSFCQDNQ